MEMGATNSRYLPDVARVMPMVTTCLSNAQRFPLCCQGKVEMSPFAAK
ncbi:MAG: hypothetical protein JWP08_4538 [Bryobacterales bacterium]|nr:hypothetical protein [Bryobacterales bacterium]